MKKTRYSNNLKKYRARTKMTQAEFATACGWKDGQQRIGLYETGRRDPSLSDIRQIISTLKELGVRASIDGVFPTDQIKGV